MKHGYIKIGHGVAVEFNPDAVPSIQWNHIDSPLLHMRSGEIHWLTLWERFRVWLDLDNEYTLEKKHSPDFVRRWVNRGEQRDGYPGGDLVRQAGLSWWLNVPNSGFDSRDGGHRCDKCGTPTEHVCSWVCVEICPRCG